MNAIPEPDRLEGVKHPNETSKVFGHDAVTSKFLQTFNKGRKFLQTHIMRGC